MRDGLSHPEKYGVLPFYFAPQECDLIFEASYIGVLDSLGRIVLFGVLVRLVDGLGL